MKTLLFTLCILFSYQVAAQDWTTLSSAVGMGIAPPWAGFKLAAYRNDLWFVNETYGPACLHLNNGTVNDVTYSGVGGDFDMAFTPGNVYFMAEFSGLYHVNTDYTISNTYFANYNYRVYQNGDTVYMVLDNSQYLAHTETGSLIVPLGFERIVAKGAYKYPSNFINGLLSKYTGVSGNGYEFYDLIDSEYFCPQFNDIKFSPYSDTVYVGCSRGITFAYNYDFLDTISPYNTTNMPAANVFEFEFDKQNRIWATFADSNNAPFALARLDGSTWTNVYTAANSPIDFTKYRGMEIDTNGNVWVAENTRLHVWGTQTPLWLSVSELETFDVELYPNPVQDVVTVLLPVSETVILELRNDLGQIVYNSQQQASEVLIGMQDFPAGVYTLTVKTAKGLALKRIVH